MTTSDKITLTLAAVYVVILGLSLIFKPEWLGR